MSKSYCAYPKCCILTVLILPISLAFAILTNIVILPASILRLVFAILMLPGTCFVYVYSIFNATRLFKCQCIRCCFKYRERRVCLRFSTPWKKAFLKTAKLMRPVISSFYVGLLVMPSITFFILGRFTQSIHLVVSANKGLHRIFEWSMRKTFAIIVSYAYALPGYQTQGYELDLGIHHLQKLLLTILPSAVPSYKRKGLLIDIESKLRKEEESVTADDVVQVFSKNVKVVPVHS